MGALCRNEYDLPNTSPTAVFKHGSQHVKTGSGSDVVHREQSQQHYIQHMAQTQIQTLTSQYNTLSSKETWIGETHLIVETSGSGA
jgi:hypothetical protein